MRILFICHRYPFPPKRGGKIRPFNIIKHLAESGHEVHVGSLLRSSTEAAEGLGLEKYCASVFAPHVSSVSQSLKMVALLPTTTPSSMGYFHSAKLSSHIKSLANLKSFDLVFVHCSSVAQYAEHLTGVKKWLDFGDMDSQKWLDYGNYRQMPLALGYKLEGLKLEREERRLSTVFDQCTATTRGELETLQRLNPQVNGGWFPNGVDSTFFAPSLAYDQNEISFIGRMDYFPNQQAVQKFVKNIFPLIKTGNPQARFTVVGAEPPSFIRELQAINGVSVTGTVADVREYVLRSAVNVAPLDIARGTQNKILEAMAMGVPVVASSAASKGVNAIKDEHFMVEDDANAFAEACLLVMSNKAERQKLGLAGRERVLSHHSWAGSMHMFNEILTPTSNARG
jgi:polysaccharide biosynthesis protein PslH